MDLKWFLILFILFASCVQKPEYPPARMAETVDDYHGTVVADPYRWLEEDGPETRAWIEAQNRLTMPCLEKIPARKKIRERLTELWNYERYSLPSLEGGLFVYTKNDGLQNQPVLYVQRSLDDEPKILFDPNTLSEDGTVAMASYGASPDGKHLLYALSSGGSDWRDLYVMEIENGRKLTDRIQWVKFFDGSWSRDGEGFFYTRYQKPEEGRNLIQENRGQRVYYHKLGTDQSGDRLVYEDTAHPERLIEPRVTEDGKFLVLQIYEGTDRRTRVYVLSLSGNRTGRPVKLLDRFDAAYQFINNEGPLFYFKTDLDAPLGRVVAVDTRIPDRESWVEILPEGKDALDFVSIVHNQLIAVVLHDAHHRIRIHGMDGSLVTEFPMPTLGSVGGIEGKKEGHQLFYSFYSFAHPHSVYLYDFEKQEARIFRSPKVLFDPEAFEVRQILATSKDGTKIPVFLAHKKGLKMNGKNPTYLYGYGGFFANMTPRFKVYIVQWMEMGGVYAQAVLRGGGEYGTEWYEQGILEKKQNVFDDFIASAEALISERVTSTDRLAIGGSSNGGLLVAACMVQRPDLFGAVLPDVGVLDMLRYHLFTIGWAWASDYGRSDDPDQFPFLYAYSPLHNVLEGMSYPATLITTADHDDRVVPAHSFKFAAALQKAQAGSDPILIRIETQAGHGGDKPVGKQIEEFADQWAFLVKHLKMRN